MSALAQALGGGGGLVAILGLAARYLPRTSAERDAAFLVELKAEMARQAERGDRMQRRIDELEEQHTEDYRQRDVDRDKIAELERHVGRLEQDNQELRDRLERAPTVRTRAGDQHP